MEGHLMKIGEIAAFFNVSVKALRLYEKKGIISPEKIDAATGYRYYNAGQVQQINALLEMKALGFSLAEIKLILNGETAKEQLMDELSKKQMAWQDTISNAQNKIDAIDGILNRISQSKPAAKIQELTDEQRAWLLVKLVCVEEVRTQSTLSEAIWL